MNKCNNCGAEIIDSTFCFQCGEKVDVSNDTNFCQKCSAENNIMNELLQIMIVRICLIDY
ncbi:hypothetical protein [Methanobrevibacter smithii]|jgi:NMD protein affecting ribosome stability and mRNA decay|uniref:hypothetical protein n=1 Tax=Methanobrevibacter smithii TaxID=2173 RepID=UPI001FCC14B8|nr:hypothetical protein [Methanobrevibacter smithii]MEE0720238.1 hypothetical protein [Methanobrevibacter smithii]BDF81328.1 hypothetical protein CE91St67_16040 [Methanobrevibacter smithii]BDF82080.1 hypothetical protein CE91St68_06370 [Methanobrevibacter smithii]